MLGHEESSSLQAAVQQLLRDSKLEVGPLTAFWPCSLTACADLDLSGLCTKVIREWLRVPLHNTACGAD